MKMLIMAIGLPVIARELLVQARSGLTYRSRLVAGAIVTLSFAFSAITTNLTNVSGAQLFQDANLVVTGLIWLFAPLLTADCLSREKREGTLGLLLMTPLTPSGIVVGKIFVHALRASSFILAAAPVMAVASLLGGVSWRAVVAMLLHQLGVLSLALSAGLLASAWCRQWMRAIITTTSIAFLFFIAYMQVLPAITRANSLVPGGLLLLGAVAVLAGSVFLAAHRVRNSWQEITLSPLAVWWLRTFCSPIFWRDLFRSSMQRSLDRNPIGWLHDCSTSARVSKWLWCGAAILTTSIAISHSFSAGKSFFWFQIGIALAMAFSGAASFRRERQNGIMELILVSPLQTEEIIYGRLKALLKQFYPAVLLTVLPLLFLAFSIDSLNRTEPAWFLGRSLLLLSSLSTLPTLGLLLSFRTSHVSVAWLFTCLLGLVVPYVLASVLSGLGRIHPSMLVLFALFQFAIGRAAISVLRQQLTRSSLAPSRERG